MEKEHRGEAQTNLLKISIYKKENLAMTIKSRYFMTQKQAEILLMETYENTEVR